MAHEIKVLSEKKVDIELVRGDTLMLTLNLKDKATDEAYTPEEGDRLIFTVRKNYKGLSNDDLVLQKTVDLVNANILEIESEDTSDLDYGSYKYDMEFNSSDGKKDTVLSGTFKLAKEVT